MFLDVRDAALFVDDRPGNGVPIVFVHGSWDDHRSWSPCAEQLARGTQSPAIYGPSLDIALAGAPNVACSYIDGAGHAAPLTHPDDLARVITDFIDGLATED